MVNLPDRYRQRDSGDIATKNELKTKKMNWSNVDLTDGYERDQNIIDPLSFDILLLEISCNIRTENLNEAGITKQFETTLQSKIDSAREVFQANLQNIIKQAKKERNA